MDISLNELTPVSKVTPKSCQSSGKLGLSCGKSSDKISKTLLTPCRRVGLKRKSISHTPRLLLNNCKLEQDACIESSNEVISVLNKPNLQLAEHVTEQVVKTNVNKPQNPCNKKSSDSCNENICNNTLTNKCTRLGNKRKKILTPKCNASNELPVETDIINLELLKSTSEHNVSNELLIKPDEINLELLDSLANNIKEKKNRCKHIELSNLYGKKHDLQTLKDLTGKWKQGCQKALLKLYDVIQQNGHTLSMAQLLTHFQIPHDLLSYNEECDEFE